MNLAQDYGVDYGHILIWADHLRRDRQRLTTSQGRLKQLHEAVYLIARAVGARRHDQLLRRMVAHANARWGEPEVIHA